MNSNLSLTFSFNQNEIRVVGDPSQPLFVAADVAKSLGFDRPENAYRLLDEDEKGTLIVSTPGGHQEMICINESGLYSLIFKSRKPEAQAFRKWVTSEVLPAIRKTGRYEMSEKSESVLGNSSDFLIELMGKVIVVIEQNIQLQEKLLHNHWQKRERLAFTDEEKQRMLVLKSKGKTITEIANELNRSQAGIRYQFKKMGVS